LDRIPITIRFSRCERTRRTSSVTSFLPFSPPPTNTYHSPSYKVAHGDIKTENILVTSWNWIYLTDFSTSFKPTFLPLDDPSVFSYFFDTSSRRSCYLAPERFYTSSSDQAKLKSTLEFGKRDGRVTEEMDVFSVGCVLAELWMEGTSPFTLTQLFKYREGQYDLEAYLNEIEEVEIRVSFHIPLDTLDEIGRKADVLSTSASRVVFDKKYDFPLPFFPSDILFNPLPIPQLNLPRHLLYVPPPLPIVSQPSLPSLLLLEFEPESFWCVW